MTQPTIEQMDVEEFINHLESTCVVLTDEPEVIPKFLAKPPRYYSFRVSEAEQMLEQFVSARIRAALEEKQGLPLDEVPDGWRFESIELVMSIDAPPQYFCRLSSFPEQYDDATAKGATLTEAFRAAIKAALAAQREG